MKRLRLATWAAAAGLGLVAGCQGTGGCGCCEKPGLMSRLGMRPRSCCPAVVEGGPVEGVPVSALPFEAGLPAPGCACGNEGGVQPFMVTPGSATPPFAAAPAFPGPPPFATPAGPPVAVGPPALPGPLPNGAAPLVPVPSPAAGPLPGFAPTTPAPPMTPPTSFRRN
jgi:hypothetical protein